MEDNRIIECIERADYLMGNLMGVKAGEEVLIVIDPQTDMRMAKVLCQMLGCPTTKSPFRNSARHLPSSFFANSHRESGS